MRRIAVVLGFLGMVTILCGLLGTPILAQESDDDKEPVAISLDPIADLNPVRTQHTVVATVLDKKNRPVPGLRVDWILARGPICVGDIVEHDDMGAIINQTKEVVRKLSNNYSISYTNEGPAVLGMGTPSPADDVKLTAGQTWLTITSPVEGETHIIAFCPAIKNANNHKAFAVKFWIDAKISWPENAVNKVGTPHTFKMKLTKASTAAPLTGYLVNWTLLDAGTPASIGDQPGNKVIQGQTDEQGETTVTLNQVNPLEGQNQVKVELRKPTGELLAIRTVTKEWIAPSLSVKKTGPEEGILGEKVMFNIEVSNPGQADAQDVVLKDLLPEGLSYVEATPAPTDVQEKELTWNLGTIPQAGTQKIVLTLKAVKVTPPNTPPWVNTAKITSKEAPEKTSTALIKIGAPEVFIVKTGQEEVRLGETITYNLTVKNNGDAVAKDLVIRDNIPGGLKFKNRTEGTPLRWNLGNLDPKQERTINYTVETTRVGTFENIAEAYVKDKLVHKNPFKTRVVAPDLTITKESARLTYLHKPMEFRIVVENKGDAAALAVEVTDTLPRALDYVKSNPRGTFKPGTGEKLATVTWNFPEIAPKSKVEITLEVRSKAITRCTNIVKLISKTERKPPIPVMEASADLEIIGVPAMHISTYDTEDPVEVGKQTVYVIETRNEGTSNCTVIKLTSKVPEEMEFMKAEGPGVSFKFENGLVTFDDVPVLPPGEKLVYKLVCRAVTPGSAKHTATLHYHEFNKDIIDEEGTSVYK